MTEEAHKESKGPQHKDLRALILYVGVPLLLYLPGEEPPHKELLGRDPNWVIFRVFLYVCVLFFGLELLQNQFPETRRETNKKCTIAVEEVKQR